MLLKKATYLISNPTYKTCPKADKPEYAFIGRSNVGKSSLINMLCNNSKLAKTSANPGKTQMINHFLIESKATEKSASSFWYLVDLPGYGYAKIAQKQRDVWEKMIADYLTNRPNLVQVFVLIDSRHEPQKIDIEFVNQLGAANVPFALVFTKADKEKPGAVQRHVKAFLEALRETWQFLPQTFITSAEKKEGRAALLAHIQMLNDRVHNDAQEV